MIVSGGNTGKCPFCRVVNRFESPPAFINNSANYSLDFIRIDGSETGKSNYLNFAKCADCKKVVLTYDQKMIFPLGCNRRRCPEEVPESLKKDYEEACLVEPLSKKSAAALGRRCLQNLLHEKGFIAEDLFTQIGLVAEKLPSHLAENIDAIRKIGNYAAHPTKFKNTGEIVEVEPQEAEWILDVLEGLFDFYYVQPKLSQERKKSLNEKLKKAGKRELK